MQTRRWLIAISFCFIVTAALGGYKYWQIRQAIAFAESFPEQVLAVEQAQAEAVQWRDQMTVLGEVVATQAVELRTEMPGRIVKVGFEAGQTVAAGQLLVELDTREEQAQLAAARADVKLASLAQKRNRQLAAKGVAAQEDLDRAQAQFQSAQANEQRLLTIIDKKTLTAPFAANTGLHQLEVGQYLNPGDLVARLVGVDELLWVDFNLPQDEAVLALGDRVELGEAGSDLQAAVVIARDAWVDPQSRHVGYRAEMANGGQLRPGAVVSVRVALGETQAVTQVPATAVRYDAFGPTVYLLQADDKGELRARRASVTLGPERGGQIIVRSGLQAGDTVATAGAFKLRDGAKVKVVAATEG